MKLSVQLFTLSTSCSLYEFENVPMVIARKPWILVSVRYMKQQGELKSQSFGW